MSLNGLDDVAVTQAYQSALAEAGGWCEPPRSPQSRAAVLMYRVQVPAQVHGKGCRRRSDQGNWRGARGARCRRTVRRQVAAVRPAAVPPPQGVGQVRARGDLAPASRYIRSVANWQIKVALTPAYSPCSRSFHHRVREVHAARHRPLYQHTRGA